MPADDLGGRDHLPLGGTAEMLGLEGRVAEHVGGGDHGDKVGSRHGGPGFVEEGAVVNVEGWGDDVGQAGPVLMRVSYQSICLHGGEGDEMKRPEEEIGSERTFES